MPEASLQCARKWGSVDEKSTAPFKRLEMRVFFPAVRELSASHTKVGAPPPHKYLEGEDLREAKAMLDRLPGY